METQRFPNEAGVLLSVSIVHERNKATLLIYSSKHHT